jgi:hypothetical protein
MLPDGDTRQFLANGDEMTIRDGARARAIALALER